MTGDVVRPEAGEREAQETVRKVGSEVESYD